MPSWTEHLLESVEELLAATEAARRMEIQGEAVRAVSDMLNEGLLPEQVEEQARIARTEGADAATAYLRGILPNYDDHMRQAVDIFKREFLARQGARSPLTPFFESRDK